MSYESAKEEIKSAADIVELVGQYVQLKKAGINFLGLCPFHSEKAPSFNVSPAKQIFHCFGCKKGGDIFDFWMEYHKVSFPQAMRDLAERYQITLPQKKITPSQKRVIDLKEELYRINEIAAFYFYNVLVKSNNGSVGRDYFKKRSISKEVIGECILGYAPAKWNGLTDYLSRKKVDMAKAVKAGLIIPREKGGYYDRFRGRVIFPIHSLSKQVAGFGARVLDDSLPKYINSPESPIFHKSELLYGLHTAYPLIRERGRVVIVEGYTDVLALRSNGFYEAVATLGTAITKHHIRRLKGYIREAVLVFDSDNAGKGAAIRSLPFFLNQGLLSRIMVLPEGDDPDSYVRKNGLKGFLGLLEEARPLFDFYIEQKLPQWEKGVEGQVSLLKEIIPLLLELDDGSQRLLYARSLSEKTGIAESIILAELKNRRDVSHSRERVNKLRKNLSSTKAKRGDDLPLLNLSVHYPQAFTRLMKKDFRILLSDPVIIEIFDLMYEIYEKDQEHLPGDILKLLDKEQTRERFREEMLAPPIYREDAVEQAITEFEDRINKIKIHKSTIRGIEKRDLTRLNQILKEKRNQELKINGDEIFQEGK